MRRFLLTLTAAGVLAAALPAAANLAPAGEELQTVVGSIAAPTRFIDGESGWPGLGRRVYNASAATNGTIMYVFDVDRETWGGAFVIEGVTDRTGEGDLDVYFYDEMGDFGGQAAPTTTAEYAKPGKGGETGFVAPGTRKAVVFTRNAIDASFTYRGFTVPVVSLGGTDLDLTVPAGATVRWLNDTGDYSFVRHTAGTPAFDSSPKPGTGIRAGDSFSHRFEEVGTFDYATAGGTGTITVTEGPGVGTPAA